MSVAGEAPRLRVAVGSTDICAAAELACRRGPAVALADIERRCATLADALVSTSTP